MIRRDVVTVSRFYGCEVWLMVSLNEGWNRGRNEISPPCAEFNTIYDMLQ